QRHGHCGSHGVRRRSGKARRNQNRRKVYIGQIAHRQQAIAHDPEHQDPEHDQGGHHGPANEEFGDVHDYSPRARGFWEFCAVPVLLPVVDGVTAACFNSTLAPGTNRNCPSVTTRSPGVRPLSTTACPSLLRLTITGRVSTVMSGLTTKTNCPCCPFWIACEGITIAFGWLARVKTTSTNCPGHRRRSGLAN